jgi:4-amino-4-deoxy-L-arabinose transferase-like glycosyltransferase
MPTLTHIFKDIRVWIIVFFVLRLFAITNPPLEVAHNWRQTTVTMAARNFLETDSNLLFPRIDIAGEKTGITGMEFPLLNYLIYLVSSVFDYAHWYGRLINLFISSIGLFFFYKIIKKYFSEPLAFKATFILLFSIWFTYSRKIMPDTFSMALVFIGFYHATNYLDKKEFSLKDMSLYFFFCLLGGLSKLPAMYILVLLIPLFVSKNVATNSKIVFAILTCSIAAIISLYYFVWVPYLNKHFEFTHFFMGKSIFTGFKEISSNLNETFQKFYEEAIGYIGFALFLIGIIMALIKKNKLILIVFTLSFVAFLIIIFKSGFTFYHHSYYIIPFAPVMSLLAAFTIQQITHQKIVLMILVLFALESVLSKFHDFKVKDTNIAVMRLENELDKLGKRSDLILINSGNVPTPMYFAHRKGWVDVNESLTNQTYIAALKKKGLRFIVILKKVFGTDLQLHYESVFENADFRIYKI